MGRLLDADRERDSDGVAQLRYGTKTALDEREEAIRPRFVAGAARVPTAS